MLCELRSVTHMAQPNVLLIDLVKCLIHGSLQEE